jgi:hypothetical protein
MVTQLLFQVLKYKSARARRRTPRWRAQPLLQTSRECGGICKISAAAGVLGAFTFRVPQITAKEAGTQYRLKRRSVQLQFREMIFHSTCALLRDTKNKMRRRTAATTKGPFLGWSYGQNFKGMRLHLFIELLISPPYTKMRTRGEKYFYGCLHNDDQQVNAQWNFFARTASLVLC